ncbi:hypothetical protein AYI68_g5524 [Smittium mucronatum]|uniref:Uncharacterized protein n=1 Tax=Smittium mucronatum TaxID=133383 RepID=A0A1R0GU24_9FUNG|nr:hypothetical protein AYI68_g5524 [Smittium mucronatum]
MARSPKFLGWSSAYITSVAEQEEFNQGSEQHTNEGSVGTGSFFWVFSQPSDLYQDTATSFRISQVKMNDGLSLPGRFADPWGDQESMHRQYSNNLLRTLGDWIPSQKGQVINNSVTIYKKSRNVEQHQRNEVKSPHKKDQGFTRGSQKTTECQQGDDEMLSEFY